MTYAIRSPKRSVEELSDLVDRTISRALLSVPGVAQIQRVGGVDREINIALHPDRLQALGITATEVNDQIRSFNINLPGGRSNFGGTEKTIRTLGSAPTVEALKNYRIRLPGGGSVPLQSLADVTDSYAETRQTARFALGKGAQVQANSSTENKNGEIGTQVVAFSILRSTGSTLVTVEEGVRKAVAQLKKTLPEDIQIELIFTRGKAIRESYQASIDALVMGSVLTVLVVGIFLKNWRATLITAIALPLSILPTFMVMRALGYTLNSMTLLALALAMGNLVDDAICMIENIDQHMQMGKKPFQAALDAACEIGLAVVATTATIVAVFLPVAFMGGVPGQFFQPFGVTVAVSTMFSTLVACTMTPMLAAYLLKEKPLKDDENNSNSNSNSNNTKKLVKLPSLRLLPYRSLLNWGLKHRITTLTIAVAFFIGSLQLIPFIPKGLFNNGDVGLSTINIELPPGSTLKETDEVVQKTMERVLQHPIVANALGTAGSGGNNGSVNTGTIYVNLTPRETRTISQQQFEKEMRKEFENIPGARIGFESGGAGGRKDVSIVLKSENPEALKQAADALERQMREIPGLVEVTSTASLVKPEILIQPEPARAADLGVSVAAIARTATLATLGDSDANLAKFNLPDRQIPIRVQLAEEFRNNLEVIRNLQIPSQKGGLVPLRAVAKIGIGSGPAQIDRFNRSRQVTIEANLQGISLGEALAKIKALPAMNPLPAGVSEESAGDAKIMQDVFSRFAGALGLAVLCIYAILVLLYNNFILPITILASLPLSIGGALLALMIAQKELALFALIGIVMLMGLVTKNAILLVDCSLANQEKGMPQFKAVKEAGVSRLRPILMTTLSTIAGMLPIALEIGAGSQVRSPMAIAVIGGMTTSTLLTLIVVPVFFTYVDNFQRSLSSFVKSPLAFLKGKRNSKSKSRKQATSAKATTVATRLPIGKEL